MTTKNEISLRELWHILNRQRLLILVLTLAALGIAFVFSLMLPKIYAAKVVILQPDYMDVAAFKLQLEATDYSVSEEMLFDKFIKNIQSNQLQQGFLKSNDVKEKFARSLDSSTSSRHDINIFNESLSIDVSLNKQGKPVAVTAVLEGKKPEIIPDILNNYVQYVDTYTIDEEVKSINRILDIKISQINKKIEGLRKTAKLQRIDTIKRLQDAIKIADTVGIKEILGVRETNDIYGYDSPAKSASENSKVMIYSESFPDYFRGSKALSAEADVLVQRKNDDSYIPTLRQLQIDVSQLEQLKLVNITASASRLDQPALVPKKPARPKQMLYIFFGLILGLMFSVFVVLFREVVNSDKREE